MSFLDEPGELSEVPLAAVLIEALNQRATGVLSVEHGGGLSRAFIREGVPVGAQSFAGFRPLGEVLLAEGVIDAEVLGASLAEMARSGRLNGAVLVEMGAVTLEQVDRALSEQQSAYLAEVAALASGRFFFDRAEPIPPWTAGIRISPLGAIVRALETPQAKPLVISALQSAAAGPIAIAPGYGGLAAAFGWSPAEEALVAQLQTPTTLDAFFADPGVPPERARAILGSLLLLGLASTRGGAGDTLESIPGVVVELADLAGVPLEPEAVDQAQSSASPSSTAASTPAGVLGAPPRASAPHPSAASVAAPASPTSTSGASRSPISAVRANGESPARRSDPDEARRRRQRLLQRAMQNMGVGPLSRQPAPPAAPRQPAPERGSRSAPTPAEAELRRAFEAAEPRALSDDLFERLGLTRTATRDQVKSAYLQLAKQIHPDRFAAPALSDLALRVKDLFSSVNEAYEILSDERKRADYLARAGRGGGGTGRAAGEDGADALVAFQKAEACVRTRDFGRARGFFEAALRADPRPEYQAAYASMLLAEGRSADRARARALAEAALRDPSCDRALSLCGILARDDGDDGRAERFFHKALAANPRNAEADRELRALEARRGRGKASTLSGLFRKK
jgi:curved DNA-binding protein CbpA